MQTRMPRKPASFNGDCRSISGLAGFESRVLCTSTETAQRAMTKRLGKSARGVKEKIAAVPSASATRSRAHSIGAANCAAGSFIMSSSMWGERREYGTRSGNLPKSFSQSEARLYDAGLTPVRSRPGTG